MADTAVLVAVLDGDPAADSVVPRLLLVDAVTDELLHTVLDAGLPMNADSAACFPGIMGTVPVSPVDYRTPTASTAAGNP